MRAAAVRACVRICPLAISADGRAVSSAASIRRLLFSRCYGCPYTEDDRVLKRGITQYHCGPGGCIYTFIHGSVRDRDGGQRRVLLVLLRSPPAVRLWRTVLLRPLLHLVSRPSATVRAPAVFPRSSAAAGATWSSPPSPGGFAELVAAPDHVATYRGNSLTGVHYGRTSVPRLSWPVATVQRSWQWVHGSARRL